MRVSSGSDGRGGVSIVVIGIPAHYTVFIFFKYHYSLILFTMIKISSRGKTIQRMLNPYGTFGICFGNNWINVNNNNRDDTCSWTGWNGYPEHKGDLFSGNISRSSSKD
jgi:hypothetical protein